MEVTAAPKKKAPVKKAAPRKQSIIRYAEPRLKPAQHQEIHPAFFNHPDSEYVLAQSTLEVSTGLEIAIPPAHIVHAYCVVPGFIVVNPIFSGYQKDLTLKLWNYTQTVIQVHPFDHMCNLFISEVKSWQ